MAKSIAINATKCNTPNITAHVAKTSTANQRTKTFGVLIPSVARALMNTIANAITRINTTNAISGIPKTSAGITNAMLRKMNSSNHLAAVRATLAINAATKLKPNGSSNDPNLKMSIKPKLNNVVIIGAANENKLIPINNQLIGLSQLVNIPINE